MNAAPTTVDPRLHAIAARPPDPSWSTEDLLAAAGDRLSERLAAMLGDLGVAKRHSVLANYPEVLFEGAAPRLDVRASELSARTAAECLEKSGAAPERIGLVLGVTSSPGRLLPSLVCDLFGLLPWLPRDAANLSIAYMGCSAIAKAVETARWYLTCCPDRLVLVCFMDAITPLSPVLPGRYSHFDEVPPEERQRTVNALHGFLFGDAAVAMLLGADGPGPAFGPVAHLTNERAEDAELGTVPDGGSDLPVVHGRRVYTLSPWVSARGAAYVEATVADLLRTHACGIASAAEATTLLLHTGSTRILDTLHDRLGLPPGSPATRSSYRVLRDYANTVGCSVPMMLAEPVTRPEGTALVVAFGLSFSCGAFTMTVPPGGWTP
ncbi:3-oxoacyl-[acyl-carrier-protein] synthase III C-terminal domain-containing protein [Streptomyces sp. 4F14]|uniref:3-oxoacyl-[acyl-carrier-protein] synthase III C-terminal domain-containing protein n=1 Tax=Streptomyces sp. 4F14 TaxID=3394380 RepID=UPI003A878500